MSGFKPGTTFAAIATLTVVQDGAAVADLTGWTFRCQLRTTQRALVADLTCTLASGPLRKVRLSAASTDAWPEGASLLGDIIATDPTGTVSIATGTFTFDTDSAVTRD